MKRAKPKRAALPKMSAAGKARMQEDIAHDIHKGYPPKQAEAIAYRRAREGYYR